MSTPGTKHAGDLGQGVVVIEPMECLRGRHDISGRVGKRHRLGAPGDRLHIGENGLELAPHLVQRLHGRHSVPETDERTRELPGARAEIDDVARLVAGEPPDRIVRIPGASTLVCAGDLGECRVRPAHLRIAVDDHRVESRPASDRLDSTRRVISSECDLGGAVAHRDEPRNDVENALARAERDVRLEVRRVLHEVATALRRAESLLRAAPRGGQPGSSHGCVRSLPAEELDDPARDERIVERERALHSGTYDDHVLAGRPCRLDDRREIQQATRRARARSAARQPRPRASRSSSRGSASRLSARRTRAASCRDRSRGCGRRSALRRARPRRARLAARAPPRPRRRRTRAGTPRRAPGTSSTSRG